MQIKFKQSDLLEYKPITDVTLADFKIQDDFSKLANIIVYENSDGLLKYLKHDDENLVNEIGFEFLNFDEYEYLDEDGEKNVPKVCLDGIFFNREQCNVDNLFKFIISDNYKKEQL